MPGFLKKVFGRRKKSTSIPEALKEASAEGPKTVLERLRNYEDLFQRKQIHLEECIAKQVAEARKHGTKNKRAALNALKRKKRLEAELMQVDGTLTTIEMQREALESAKNNIHVIGVLSDAKEVLKNVHNRLTPDKVLDIMDEVNEQQEMAQEIAEAMANPIGLRINSGVDEAELEQELEALEQEELDRALLRVDKSAANSVLAELEEQHSDSKIREKAENPEKEIPDEDEKELQQLAEWSS